MYYILIYNNVLYMYKNIFTSLSCIAFHALVTIFLEAKPLNKFSFSIHRNKGNAM